MAVRIFLGLSALIWLPYGIYCFFQPASLAEAAGVVFTSPTGATELGPVSVASVLARRQPATA